MLAVRGVALTAITLAAVVPVPTVPLHAVLAGVVAVACVTAVLAGVVADPRVTAIPGRRTGRTGGSGR
ncbi:MAG TPA: hypothetical protein VEM58_09155 [Streptosporangiaceae bacterium]|nr:hypothetical protein [Streptosporangiaceae bacterium]